jgi:hypothetical protein
VDPVPDALLLRKSGSAGNRTRDHWICSQELWPLDHRVGPSIYKKLGQKYLTLIKQLELILMPNLQILLFIGLLFSEKMCFRIYGFYIHPWK